MKIDIIDVRGEKRLATLTGYAARPVMKEVPGARWNSQYRGWTYPLYYGSVLALGEAAKLLREDIIPTPEAVAWAQEAAGVWSQLQGLSSDVLGGHEAIEGFFGHQQQCAEWLSLGEFGGRLDTSEMGCLVGETMLTVNRGGKGFTLRMDELVHRFNGGNTGAFGRSAYWDPNIPTKISYRDDSGAVRSGAVKAAWVSGVKPVFEVVTATGHRIKASGTHPFLTEQGWVELASLHAGDEVYVNIGQGGRERKPKVAYHVTCVPQGHPFATASTSVPGKRVQYRVETHRLVAEATLNGLTLGAYKEELWAGNLNFTFIDPKLYHVHHIDHDPLNNAPTNLEVLTPAEHRAHHLSPERVLFRTGLAEITAIVPCGEQMTYDIEMAEAPHNYIADGFVVHNSGKTRSTLRAAWHCWQRGEKGILLVSTLKSVKSGWEKEVANVADLLPLDNEWHVFKIEGTAAKRRKLIDAAKEMNAAVGGAGVVMLVNHEQLKMHSRLSPYGDIALKRCIACGGDDPAVKEVACHAHDKELNDIELVAFAVDECFVPTAMVDTPWGPRPIGDLKPGDFVWGVDELTGGLTLATVKHVMRREAAVVGGFVTPGHPVRVSSGYVPVADLKETDYAITLGGGSVPTLRQDVLTTAISGQPWAEVLHENVFRSSTRGGDHAGRPGTLTDPDEQDARTPGRSGEAEGSSVGADQSFPESGSAGKAARSGLQVHDSRRQGPRFDDATGSTVGRAGTGMGPRAVRTPEGEGSRGALLLVGPGERGAEDSRRAGRELSQVEAGQGARRAEGCVPGLGRLDGSEVLEPRDPERAAAVPVGDSRVPVVNIETSTSNYFVHGLLVHNCHRLMSPTAQQTRAGWKIADAAPRAWGLTGTPGSTSVMENTWALMRLVGGAAFPPKSSWCSYYAEAGYNSDGFWEVGRLRSDREEEFHATYGAISRRVLKAQVLDLPPLLRGGTLERHIEMGTEQRRSYNEMRDKLRVAVEEGTITVANQLAQTTRLIALASSCGVPGPNWGNVIGYNKETGEEILDTKMKLVTPSNKIDAVVDMVLSGDIAPGTVFQFVSAQLLTLTREALITKTMHLKGSPMRRPEDFGVVMGGVPEALRAKAIADFQSGKIPFFGFTVAAGGAGITLTRANTMIAVERPWSPILWQQAQDRVHRIGSEIHDAISIIDLISEETIEMRQIKQVLTNRQALTDLVRDKERMMELIG